MYCSHSTPPRIALTILTSLSKSVSESQDVCRDERGALMPEAITSSSQGSQTNSLARNLSEPGEYTEHWMKRQRDRLKWLICLPWGKYLNAPTLAAAAGLSVGCPLALPPSHTHYTPKHHSHQAQAEWHLTKRRRSTVIGLCPGM